MMAEYIEREAVNALIEAECSPKVAAFLNHAIDNIPAADVRPVVLCRDCKYNCGAKTWVDHEITADCTNGHGYPPLDWFCADGVKREES